jgi:hypothetical protein
VILQNQVGQGNRRVRYLCCLDYVAALRPPDQDFAVRTSSLLTELEALKFQPQLHIMHSGQRRRGLKRIVKPGKQVAVDEQLLP